MLDMYKFKHFQNHPNILHGVSTKSDSMSYKHSFALHTGEERDAIVRNRKAFLSKFTKDANYNIVLAHQTHSSNIHCVTHKETRGWESMQSAIHDCDALISDLKGVIVGVLTADCVPILLYDKTKQVIAAIHAGWKGTHNNILRQTVLKMMQDYHCDSKDIIAGIAPSIGSCCYEVGEDVAKHFQHYENSLQEKGTKYMLDLPNINKHQLLEAGLNEKNIELSHICTACEVDTFFSYRKEQGCSGRFISIIGLKE